MRKRFWIKLTALLCTLALCPLRLPVSAGHGAEPGDLSGDGVIDTEDAYAVLAYFALRAAGGQDETFLTPAADLDGNGSVDTADAYTILAYFAYHAAGGIMSLTQWQTPDLNPYLLETIASVPDGGGYYTGTAQRAAFAHTAWEGMDLAVCVGEQGVTIDLAQARPSFCSCAVYMVLLKSLLDWDTQGVISTEAWTALKPYTVEGRAYPPQHDGAGCWGRANANGPGAAVLAAQFHAGTNTYLPPRSRYADTEAYLAAWAALKPGDLLKIFWNEYIGVDGSRGERGHMTVFLGFEPVINADGTRDGLVTYWSSNGSCYMPEGGYGKQTRRLSEIYRAVATRIDNPAGFADAAKIAPDDHDPWLYALDGTHLATEEELIAAIQG